jgi:hypothetical protein
MKMEVDNMLGSLLFLGALGISGIHCGVENYQIKKESAKFDKNGNITYFDRKGQDYINHEKIYRSTQYDKNNQEHHQTIGVNSGIVYHDDYDDRSKWKRDMSNDNRRNAIEYGYPVYENYDPRFNKFVTTEIATGKVIACIFRDQYSKECRKFYVHDDMINRYGKCAYNMSSPNDFGVIITEEEYNKIKSAGVSPTFSLVPNREVYNQLTKLTDKLADEAYEADVRKYWGTVGNKADEIIENYYKTKYGSDYQNHMKK